MCLAFVASEQTSAADTTSAPPPSLRAASYDGTWTGTVKCLYDPGLWPQDECDVGFTLQIHGTDFSVEQVVKSKAGTETRSKINSGKFHAGRLSTNGVAVSLDTGNDEDGTWVETWSFVMTLKDEDHMLVQWTRVVNNLDMPPDKRGSKFFIVGLGELARNKAKL
jgi:hypothetical protein